MNQLRHPDRDKAEQEIKACNGRWPGMRVRDPADIAQQELARAEQMERNQRNVFHNRMTGHNIRVSRSGVFWGCLLAGPFFFAIVGEWGHAIFSLGLALVSGGVTHFIYPFFANSIIKHKWESRGYFQS